MSRHRRTLLRASVLCFLVAALAFIFWHSATADVKKLGYWDSASGIWRTVADSDYATAGHTHATYVPTTDASYAGSMRYGVGNPSVFADGSNNNVTVSTAVFDATNGEYVTITCGADAQDVAVGFAFNTLAWTSFNGTTGATLDYILSDATGGNGAYLKVYGTDNTLCETSAKGSGTSWTTITEGADLSDCTVAAGGLVRVELYATCDSADTVKVRKIGANIGR